LNRDKSKKYFLGVDTGSTKTHTLIADVNGKAVGMGEAGCGNYEVVGLEGMISSMNTAIDHAIINANIKKNAILGMGFGFCGYDWPSEYQIMQKGVEALEIEATYKIVNDVELGLIAGTKEGWGVAVDAGTGNNIRGRNKRGDVGRITGNSIVFGEIGGASEMVWQAMVAVAHAWTLRGPETSLTQAMINFLKVENEETLIEGLATKKILLSPDFAIEIINLAKEGDFVAQQIVTCSAHELAKNTNAVIRQLGFQAETFEVILIGSVFNAGEIFTAPFSDLVLQFAPNARLKKLYNPPVIGAILLAAEEFKYPNREFRQILKETTLRLLE
jgi:N-acetylglucosamine kinase-like BadF-type ATPase